MKWHLPPSISTNSPVQITWKASGRLSHPRMNPRSFKSKEQTIYIICASFLHPFTLVELTRTSKRRIQASPLPSVFFVDILATLTDEPLLKHHGFAGLKPPLHDLVVLWVPSGSVFCSWHYDSHGQTDLLWKCTNLSGSLPSYLRRLPLHLFHIRMRARRPCANHVKQLSLSQDQQMVYGAGASS